MDKSLQKKLVGAAVLIALVVIFLPMLLDGGEDNESLSLQIEIPDKPIYDVPNRLQQPGSQVPAASAETHQPGTRPAVAVAKPIAAGQAEISSQSQIAKVESPPPVSAAVVKPSAKLGKITPQPKKPQASDAKAKKSQVKKPVAKEKAGKGAGYVVQVGSFSQQQNAASLKDKLVASGFPAFVQTAAIGAKSIYRVKVGPRPNRDGADQLRLRLIDKASVEGIIVAHP